MFRHFNIQVPLVNFIYSITGITITITIIKHHNNYIFLCIICASRYINLILYVYYPVTCPQNDPHKIVFS